VTSEAVQFHPEATSELLNAVDWYEASSPGLGGEFLRAFDATTAFIERNPAAYPRIRGSVRRAVMRRFPYSVIYTSGERGIMILACFHGRRDPERWKQRLGGTGL
jgi:plasmid stabilization system protein ParE